jgi:sialidase-1
MKPHLAGTRLGRAAALLVLAALPCLGAEPENRIVVSIPSTAQIPRNTEGSFASLHSGRILYYYSQFQEGWFDECPSRIAGIHSDDQGLTWSSPEVIFPNAKGQNLMSVSFVRLSPARLAVFYVRKNNAMDCRPVMRISDDEAKTWSPEKPVFDAPGYFVLNNDRVIRTSRERLILPVAYHRMMQATGSYKSLDSHGLILWYLSDDDGATWRQSKTWWALPVPSSAGLQEPGVVELADRSIFSWARTDRGCQYGFRSTDGGETFSAPVPTELKSPCAPASIKRLPGSFDLLAIYDDHSGRFPYPRNKGDYGGRTPLVAAISRDGGRTWPLRRQIDSEQDYEYCYTAIHFTGDSVLLAYMAGDDHGVKPFGMRMRRISLSWLPH